MQYPRLLSAHTFMQAGYSKEFLLCSISVQLQCADVTTIFIGMLVLTLPRRPASRMPQILDKYVTNYDAVTLSIELLLCCRYSRKSERALNGSCF